VKGKTALFVWAFVGIQGALYLRFLSLDLAGRGNETTPLKYAGIALCLLASLYGSMRGGDRLVTAGLALTLGADTFLLLLDRCYALGVLLFCLVQGVYLLRICRHNGGRAAWLARCALPLLALCLLVGLHQLSLLNGLALFYLSQFLCNIVQSLRLTGRWARLFSLGLILFLSCDLCVGVVQGLQGVPLPLLDFARIGMWLFYLPGQVLIVLSGLPERMWKGDTHENQ
jgi:hypothetical protein